MCVCFYVCVWCFFSRIEDAILRLYASNVCQPPPKLESPHPTFVTHTLYTLYRTLYTRTIHTVNTHTHTHTHTLHRCIQTSNIQTHILAHLPLSFFCTLTAGSLAIAGMRFFFSLSQFENVTMHSQMSLQKMTHIMCRLGRALRK